MVWLGFSEEEVWNMVPRKFFALLKVHQYVQEQKYSTKKKDTPQTAFIDQISNW